MRSVGTTASQSAELEGAAGFDGSGVALGVSVAGTLGWLPPPAKRKPGRPTLILTEVPGSTCSPATGSCDATFRKFSVVCVKTIENLRFASRSVLTASKTLMPTTLIGTVACGAAGAPVDTLMVTVLPAATTVPAAGDCEMTSPAGTSAFAALVVVTLKPAPSSVDLASFSESPTTLGTLGLGAGGAPVDTLMVTVLPAATTVPAAGDWEMTSPAGTSAFAALVVVTLKPAPSSVDLASFSESATTLGTLGLGAGGGPVDTPTVTVLPAVTTVPAAGDCEMTSPAGTSAFAALVVVTLKPAPSSVDLASASESPITLGTCPVCGDPSIP